MQEISLEYCFHNQNAFKGGEDNLGHILVGDNHDPHRLFVMGLYQLYGFNSAGSVSMEEAARLLGLASDKGEALASLLLGLIKEVSADYSSAIRFYSKGYGQLNLDPAKKAGKVAYDQFSSLRSGIQSIIATQGFCSYSGGKFLFKFSDTVRKELSSKLPPLLRDLDRYREDVLENAPKDTAGEEQHKYWNLLFMPLTVISAAAGRDYINIWLEERSFPAPKPNPQFENAMGRCLIDDDDSTDNDYIISGLRIMAGHDKDPFWQYLTGLWYENDPDSKDLKEAALWYEMAKSHLPAASDGFERVTSNPIYRIPDSIEEGTAEECLRLAQSYGSNRELANAWNIEAALRGDISALRKLEQMSPAIEKDIKKSTPFYSAVQSEQKTLESNLRSWKSKVSETIGKMLKEEERLRKEEEERLRKEEEERLRKEREEKLRLEREEKLRLEREEERLRKEAEEKLRKELEEKLRLEMEEKLRREMEEKLKREQEAKNAEDDAKWQKVNLETQKIRKKFSSFSSFEKEEALKVKGLNDRFDKALKHLEECLIQDEKSCKFFQRPIYKKCGFDSIDECVSYNWNVPEMYLRDLNEAITFVEGKLPSVDGMLTSIEEDKDRASVSKKQKEVKKLLQECEKRLSYALQGDSISKVAANIEMWEKGKPKPYVKPLI